MVGGDNIDKKDQQYILRHAADMYWIIKIDQQESDYVPPLLINECGAMIWDGLQAGYSVEDLSKKLHDQYGIELKEAFNDVSDFIEQLTSRGIMN